MILTYTTTMGRVCLGSLVQITRREKQKKKKVERRREMKCMMMPIKNHKKENTNIKINTRRHLWNTCGGWPSQALPWPPFRSAFYYINNNNNNNRHNQVCVCVCVCVEQQIVHKKRGQLYNFVVVGCCKLQWPCCSATQCLLCCQKAYNLVTELKTCERAVRICKMSCVRKTCEYNEQGIQFCRGLRLFSRHFTQMDFYSIGFFSRDRPII